jgi:Acetyltransferase (GNAT) domain
MSTTCELTAVGAGDAMRTGREFVAGMNGRGELCVTPYDSARSEWHEIVSSVADTTLYHGERWLEVLRRAYGFEFVVASLRSNRQTTAACLLARSRNPFSSRLIGLPFSDLCPPLGRDGEGPAALVAALAAQANEARAIEIRGIAAAGPWQVLANFENWECALGAPIAEIARKVATNFRRNVCKALDAGVHIERGSAATHMERFYALHRAARRRTGLPAQPSRFFEIVRAVYASCEDLEVRIASLDGADLAAVVTLREAGRIYYKWGARAAAEKRGAGHLLIWSILQHHAADATALDLGRADIRNQGLARFKRECGGAPTPLPYSFLPRAPRQPSAEMLTGTRAAAACVWRRLPEPVCRAIESSLYGYLT